MAAVFDFACEAAGLARDFVVLPLFGFAEPDRLEARFVELPARELERLLEALARLLEALARLLEALARLLELPLLVDLPLLLADLRLVEERLEPLPFDPLRELDFVFVLV